MVAPSSSSSNDQYSPIVGAAFGFNLIVGVGALSLPLAFFKAGITLSTLYMAFVAVLAYITATWVIESLSSANALVKTGHIRDVSSRPSLLNVSLTSPHPSLLAGISSSEPQSSTPLIENNSDSGLTSPAHLDNPLDIDYEVSNGPSYSVSAPGEVQDSKNHDLSNGIFSIVERYEYSKLAEMLLPRWAVYLVKTVIIIYLFGDLAIYAVVIPSSLAKVTGGSWLGTSIHGAYLIYLTIFVCSFGVFLFFDVTKSTLVQYITSICRHLVFNAMIIISIYISATSKEPVGYLDLPQFNVAGMRLLIGVSSYAFVSHHSIPSIVYPLKNHNSAHKMFGILQIGIYSYYLLLSWSACFAFGLVKNSNCLSKPGPICNIQELYTNNFASQSSRLLAIFIVLFPTLVLPSSFVIIGCTLRQNLESIFPKLFINQKKVFRRVFFFFATLLPPVLIAFITTDVDTLVSLTGSLGGLCIIFIFPSLYVLYSRREVETLSTIPPLTSPFSKKWQPLAMILWGVVLLIYSLISQIITWSK